MSVHDFILEDEDTTLKVRTNDTEVGSKNVARTSDNSAQPPEIPASRGLARVLP